LRFTVSSCQPALSRIDLAPLNSRRISQPVRLLCAAEPDAGAANPILQANTAVRTDQYRKCRHGIWNIYATNLDPERTDFDRSLGETY
jgi:hypothetical protein